MKKSDDVSDEDYDDNDDDGKHMIESKTSTSLLTASFVRVVSLKRLHVRNRPTSNYIPKATYRILGVVWSLNPKP